MDDTVRLFGRAETFVLPMVAIPVVSGAAISVTAIIATQWHKFRQAEIEASLKHDLLDRGMSAEEIDLVMRATRPRGSHFKKEMAGRS